MQVLVVSPGATYTRHFCFWLAFLPKHFLQIFSAHGSAAGASLGAPLGAPLGVSPGASLGATLGCIEI